MFDKLLRMWNGLGTMDIALAVMGFVTAGAIYAAFLVLRYEAGWRGRRTAYLALAAFSLVAVTLVPVTHF